MQSKRLNVVVHLFMILMVICVVLPLVAVLMISISNENDVVTNGYSFIPQHIDFTAYRIILADYWSLLRAIGVTLLSAGCSGALVVILNGLLGYTMSRKDFAGVKFLNRFILIPMLFSGGLIPTYIVNTQYLHLSNNILVYILPAAVTSWNVILFRTFFNQLPQELTESARIDGATEMKVFLRIIIPMSKPIVASVFFTTVIAKWNDFTAALYYISNTKLYNIQFFLQKVLRESAFINKLYKDNPLLEGTLMPEQTLKYAMVVLACIPVILSFPYMQKYFSKGIAVGSVKG